MFRWLTCVALGLSAAVLSGCLGGCPPPPLCACTVWVRPGESIQAAVDAAPEGAVICLEAGEWIESVSITKSLTLRGAREAGGCLTPSGGGPATTTIRGLGGELSSVLAITPPESSAITVLIAGLTIQVVGTSGTGVGCLALEKGTSLVIIEDCTILGGMYGVFSTVDIHIAGCTISDHSRGGIILELYAVARIIACTLSLNRSYPGAIALEAWSQAIIHNCTIFSNSSGISLYGDNQALITDCTISDNGFGVSLSGFSRATITDCTVSGSTLWEGIGVMGYAQLNAARCTISANAGGGIFAATWDEPQKVQIAVAECTIRENSMGGLALYGNTEATITGCTILENQNGVEIADTSWVAITGNVIQNNNLGVALVEQPCFDWALPEMPFAGYVTGKRNTITGNPEGNVCPPELSFLTTAAGGELDRR